MMNQSVTKRAAVCVTTVASLVTGCAAPDRLVHSNYDQIRSSVHTRDDVTAILGEPDNKFDDLWIYQRPDQHLQVHIEFDDKGRVSRTQWIDAMANTWEDTQDKKPAGK